MTEVTAAACPVPAIGNHSWGYLVRKLLAVLITSMLGLSLTAVAQADTTPGGAEGCVASSAPVPTVAPGVQVVYNGSCSYTATRTGGFVAAGNWSITVTRGTTVVFSRSGANKGSCHLATTQPGDVVRIAVFSPGGVIAAGNPFPSATPSTGGSTQDCG